MECIIPFVFFIVFATIVTKIVKRAGVVGELAKWAWGGSKAGTWSSTRGMDSARRRLGRYTKDLEQELELDPNPLMRELKSFMRERDLTGIELDTSDVPILEEVPPLPEEPIEELLDEPIEELFDEPIDEPVDEPVEEPVEEPIDELLDESIEELIDEPVEELFDEPIEVPTSEPAPVAGSGSTPGPATVGPATVGPAPPAPRDLATTLFDSASIGSAVQDRFERQYRGTRATWSGVIDRVERFTDDPDLGPGPGLRLEAEVPPPEGEYGRAVRIVCALPLEAESDLGDRGDQVELEGTLVSCDPYLWRFSLSHGRLR